jgi:hypothetical protein
MGRSSVMELGMSWGVEVMTDDSGEWERDPVRFETMQEALAYARDLEFRWAAVRDRRILEMAEPANACWTARGVSRLANNATK